MADQTRLEEPDQKAGRRGAWFLPLLIPIVLIGGLIAVFLYVGPAGIFPGEFPPVEDLSFGRVTLAPEEIQLVVTNGGPSPTTIAQVLVDDAYWQHTISDRTLDRLESTTITIPYPWVEGEPVVVIVITETGTTFTHEIGVATSTPAVDRSFLVTFALLGLYIGVLPVLMGMTFKPFLSTLSTRWIAFFMALTAGVLIFLGIETFVEALEEAQEIPTALGNVGLVSVVALGSFLLIFLGSRWLQSRGSRENRVVVAFAVASGIGLHNLGEGLAVGSAYRLGEIALGAFLVIGFAIHNTTEGLGIVSILAGKRSSLTLLLILGLIAGVPTVFGAWAGAFLFSPLIATVFLAVAAGAIAEVTVDVLKVVRTDTAGGLGSPESLAGLAVGLAIMYLTGLFVAA